MRPLIPLALVAMIAWSGAETASACSPPGDPVAWAKQQETAYLTDVTAIYIAVAEDVVGEVDSGVTFTIRRTENVWGSPGPAVLNLSHESGACSNYLALWLEDFTGRAFQDGEPVRVFVTPAAAANPTLLYIVPEGSIAEGMMTRWRALSAKADR